MLLQVAKPKASPTVGGYPTAELPRCVASADIDRLSVRRIEEQRPRLLSLYQPANTAIQNPPEIDRDVHVVFFWPSRPPS